MKFPALALIVGLLSCVSGPVRAIVRSDGERVVVDVAGRTVAVRAGRSLRDQLLRLDGAVVDVRGDLGRDLLVVRGFELVDAGDGLTPMVGRVLVDQSGVMLDDEVTGTRISLRGEALSDLKALHRARVWVTGSIVGTQALLIAHWGLLQPASEAP
jgi:hypothetical protein